MPHQQYFVSRMWYQSREYVVTYGFNPHFPYYWWGCVLSCLDHFDLYFICISIFIACLLKSFSFSNWNTYLCRVLCSMSVLSVYIVNIFPFDVLEFLFGWNSLGCTHLSFMVSGIFKVYLFIYLSVYFGKCNERERQVFHLLMHFPNGWNGQGWTRQEPGASSCLSWVPGPKHFCCFLRRSSR